MNCQQQQAVFFGDCVRGKCDLIASAINWDIAFIERLKQKKPGNLAYLRRLAGEQDVDGYLAFEAAEKEMSHFISWSPSVPGGSRRTARRDGREGALIALEMPKTAHWETEAGSCMDVIIVSSVSAYFSCKLTQKLIRFGAFTMPDCVPKDGKRKAGASAQLECWARVCAGCGGSSVLLPVCSLVQFDFSSGSAKQEWRASLRPGNVLENGKRAAVHEKQEDTAAAWLAKLEAVPFWAPQIVLFQGQRATLHPFIPPSVQSWAALFLSWFLFLLLKGHCGKQNQKFLVHFYQKSRTELCRSENTLSLGFALAQEQIFAFSPCCPKATVSLLWHTQATEKQNMFFSSFLFSAPKIMKYDNDIIDSSFNCSGPAGEEMWGENKCPKQSRLHLFIPTFTPGFLNSLAPGWWRGLGAHIPHWAGFSNLAQHMRGFSFFQLFWKICLLTVRSVGSWRLPSHPSCLSLLLICSVKAFLLQQVWWASTGSGSPA